MTGIGIVLAVGGAALQGAVVLRTARQLYQLRRDRWPDDQPLFPRVREAGIRVWRMPGIVWQWLVRPSSKKVVQVEAEATFKLGGTATAEAMVWPTSVDEQVTLLRLRLGAIEEQHAKDIKSIVERMRTLEKRVQGNEQAWDADLKSQTRLALGWMLVLSVVGTAMLVIAPLV